MRYVQVMVLLLLSGMHMLVAQISPYRTEKPDDLLRKSEAGRYALRLKARQSENARRPFDVTFYRLDLRITTAPAYLLGHVTVRALSTTHQLASVELDLINTMVVDSVKVESSTAQYVQYPATLSIALDRPYDAGEMVELQIYYRGVPAPTGFGSFLFGSHNNTPWVWTLSEPYGARDWWPCNDHPLDKADSVDVWVTCRRDLKAASNGRLVDVVDNPDSTRTYKWAERYPIATYLVFTSLTNYAEFTDWFHYAPGDSMPVVNYVLPEDLAFAEDSLPRVIEMLRIFSDRYGLYPFIREKYGHAEFGRGGAMEHQTMTSLVRGAMTQYVLAHELAHHWFGDLITCATWQDLWLNEGFASYSESIYAEGAYGIAGYMATIRATLDAAKVGVGSVIKADTSDVGRLFDAATTYRKGASVLHMLRHVLGDSVFFRCLRSYVADPRFRYGVATTADFRGVCESVAVMPLGWFFDQWLTGENYPQYSLDWSSRAATRGYTVTLDLSQTTGTTNPSFFVMPVDVRLSSGDWDTTVVLFNNTNPQQFVVTTSHKPVDVELDPDVWILRDIVSPNVLPVQFSLLQNYPNPFNGTTTIEYTLPHAEFVRVSVFSLLGQEIRTLVNSLQYPGEHRVSLEAGGLASGVYLYRITAGSFSQTRKLVIVR